MKKIYDLIILGAGISGIGCANSLLKNNYNDFKIISPNIGGRIFESNLDNVEYGAYYVMGIYKNVLKFINKGKRINFFDLVFYKDGKKYKLFNIKIVHYFPQLIKLIFILFKFKIHYQKFKKNCEYKNQVECLKEDKYLLQLYNTKADFFIKEKKLQKIVYDYLAEVLHGTAFVSIKKLNAFTFLQFSLPLIVSVYEFSFKKGKVKELLESNFISDEVVSIFRENNEYRILTKKGDNYFCKKLISALSPNISKKLLNFKDKLREPVSVFMFHVSGEIKDSWGDGKYDLFNDDNEMLAIALQKDDTYLFYSIIEKPDINKYFNNFFIIKQKFWNPAFNIGGSNLVNFKQGENLYVIGDNNICGLEDSYIYGIYAANKILGKIVD